MSTAANSFEVVGACLSQFHDDADSFELLLAFADGREVGFVVSRTVAQKIGDEFANEFTSPSPQTNLEGVDIPRLPVGTPVTKVLGYPFPGTVVAAFHTLSGQERFVVEATGEGYRGMLHIFNGDQLRATTEGQP